MHWVRQFKLSNDPQFAAKLRDIVGLYVDPPAHAIVLSVDEKVGYLALDRTQPGLPMKRGGLVPMTHDYKRHGTTTLFAALDVLDGKVIGRRHAAASAPGVHPLSECDRSGGPSRQDPSTRSSTTTRSTNIPSSAPGSTAIPASSSTSRRSRRSWLNAVEGFFAKLTKRRLKRGVSRSFADLQAAINRFLAETNRQPKPFKWVADPNAIIRPSPAGTKC